MNKKKVYLDYAATTPVDNKVLEAMRPYFSRLFGNPMSLHSFGRVASVATEKSRKQVADFLNCQPQEIVFTSGATESNNLAVKGIIKAYYKHNKILSSKKPHIITTAFEHHCVLNACKKLEKDKLAEITYLPVYENGIVKAEDVKKVIKPNTVLVSVMYVNNEIGTVQPIAEIGQLIKAYNLKANSYKLVFHTDATQAVNYFNCDVEKLNVDLLSFSGHKLYGPKGVGALYIRKGTVVKQIQNGGEQENNLRAGTHNVPGIVGLGVAIKRLANNHKNILDLRNFLIKKVLKEIPDSWLNGDKIKRSPNNANFGFKNVEGESLVLMLDSYEIAASTGSACSSGTLKPSHVLTSLGLKPEDAHGSLRITLGKYTTKKEIDHTIKILKKVVKKLRGISGDILDEFK